MLSSELSVVAPLGASCPCDLRDPATDGAGVVALGWELSDVGCGEVGENSVAAVGAMVEGAKTVGDGATAGVAVVVVGDGEFVGRLGFIFIIMFMFIIFIIFIFPVGGFPVGRHFELLLFEPLQVAGREPFPATFELQPQLFWLERPEEEPLPLLAPFEELELEEVS